MRHHDGGHDVSDAAAPGVAATTTTAAPADAATPYNIMQQQPQQQPAAGGRGGGDDLAELLGGLHGAGGEYEVVGPTDAGAALGSLAGSLLGSVGAGVVGASLGASAAAVTGAAGMGAALGAALGHSLPSFRSGGGGCRGDEYDGGDVPLLGDEDVAIERGSRRIAEETESTLRGAKPRIGGGGSESAVAVAGEAAVVSERVAPELIGLQPLCEMGVNAGMYLGHGHTVAPGRGSED